MSEGLVFFLIWLVTSVVIIGVALRKEPSIPIIVAAAPPTQVETVCSYCGGKDFYEGPCGGGSINILCAKATCRHWFNHTPFGLEDLKRVEPLGDA